MKKEDKDLVIKQLNATVKEYGHFYFVDIEGLNAQQTSDLRRLCFKQDVKLIVVKNKLIQKALEQMDVDFSCMYPSLAGSTALMLSNTGNAPAKLIKEFSKKIESGRPVLKMAYVEECFYGADQLETLTSIKSRFELIGDVIALLQSPAKNVVSALQSSGNTLHGVLQTLSER